MFVQHIDYINYYYRLSENSTTTKVRNNLKQNKQNKPYTAKNHRTDYLNYR